MPANGLSQRSISLTPAMAAFSMPGREPGPFRIAEVERREREIETGQMRPLAGAGFWRQVEADLI